jgi:nitrile hydratase subunit alpha
MSIPGDEQFNYSANRELESAAKVRALESLLIEKGIIGQGHFILKEG